MTRIRSISLGRRPLLLVLLAAALALVIAGLLVQPASRAPQGDVAASGGETYPATGGTTTGADPVAMPGELVDPAIDPAVDAGGGAAPRELSKAEGAGISADEAVATSIAAPDVPASATSALAMPGLDARIVRTASLELLLRRGTFEDRWSDAQAVAGAFGGYIVSASRSGGDRDARTGVMTMRVPSARFDAAVDRLRDIKGAKVERLDVASQDVTQEFVDVRSRLRHDRAVEARLIALLARTETVSEVLAVQARLDQVQEQIEVSRGRLQYLEKLTAMSTIELQLRERGARLAGERASKDDSVLAEAWDDARERFTENVAAAVVWVGGALPALLVLAAFGILGRVAWRRHVARTDAGDRPETTP